MFGCGGTTRIRRETLKTHLASKQHQHAIGTQSESLNQSKIDTVIDKPTSFFESRMLEIKARILILIWIASHSSVLMFV
jgi:hypothetical protein